MTCSGIIAAIGFVLVSRHRSTLAHGRNSRNTRNARNESPAGQTLDAQNNPVCLCARHILGSRGRRAWPGEGGACRASCVTGGTTPACRLTGRVRAAIMHYVIVVGALWCNTGSRSSARGLSSFVSSLYFVTAKPMAMKSSNGSAALPGWNSPKAPCTRCWHGWRAAEAWRAERRRRRWGRRDATIASRIPALAVWRECSPPVNRLRHLSFHSVKELAHAHPR